ncbi:MAG: hypothetical protein MI784_06875, partial [Cytophagales bacterium]|nr:hypothetical protein [Cytophagales bacterium]
MNSFEVFFSKKIRYFSKSIGILLAVSAFLFFYSGNVYAQHVITVYDSTLRSIDNTQSIYPLSVSSSDVTPCHTATVDDVNVAIDWEAVSGDGTFRSAEFGVYIVQRPGMMAGNYKLVDHSTGGSPSSSYTGTTVFSRVSTIFDDEAGTSVDGQSHPTAGSFSPNVALSSFDGGDPEGSWVIVFHDTETVAGRYVNVHSVTVEITCPTCNDPTTPVLTLSQAGVCAGDPVTINIAGTLNNATNWHVYTGTCGGTPVGQTSGTSLAVTPSAPSTTYYVRGEDGAGCLDESNLPCSTVTAYVNANDATFTYGASSFCSDNVDPEAVVTGDMGGTFSATPAGLVLAPDGEIDLDASVANNYSVTYATSGGCSASHSENITIFPADDTSFDYAERFYCGDDSDPMPTISGVGTGLFSVSPSGLIVDPGTGQVDLGSSSFGEYVVTYATSGTTCPTSTTDSVRVTQRENPAFSYPGGNFCTNTSPRIPAVNTPGGTFSVAESGLSIDSNTGVLNLAASTAGVNYTVKYRTNGECPDSILGAVFVRDPVDPSFNFSQASYCENISDPTPTISGVSGGAFSSGAGLSINSSSGEVDLSASTPGAYQVRYISVGACPDTMDVVLNVLAADDPSFNFSASSYCSNVTDPTPTVTGLAGGVFSAGAGLIINSSSGVVDLAASIANSYQVRYITTGTCPDTSDVALTVQTADNSSFSFGASSYCINGVDPVPTVMGLSGGIFFSSAGISVHASSGSVDLSASTAGSRTVSYRTTGTCPDTTDVNLTINAADDASFNFGSGSYCANGTDPTPVITGLTGGTFSSSLGLAINSSSGEVDLSASSSGSYAINYSTSGTCPNSSSVNLTVNAADNSAFNYASSSFCVNGTDPSPSFVALSGGTYNSASGLSVNSSSGLIDLSLSSAGAHTMTYTTAGTCPESTTINLTINPSDNASFSYGAAAFCSNVTDPAPLVTGLSGGTFSAGSGLVINSSTGVVDLSASTTGSYTINYLTNGTCPNTAGQAFTVNASEDATFGFGAASYCANAADPTPSISGTTGGTFSSVTGLLINSSTGQVNLSSSTLGVYSVTYITPGSCPDTSSVSLTVASLDDASFSFSMSSYCENGTDPSPNSVSTPGGTFSSASGMTVNSSSGQIDLSTGSPGAHSISYLTAGSCPNSSTVNFTLAAADDASFSYGASTFCANVSDPSPTITGVSGGSFSVGTGLSLNASTGAVDLSASTLGSYTVTYTTVGPCPNTSTQALTVSSFTDATFSYSQSSYCSADADPTPSATNAGGTYSSVIGLTVDGSSGEVDLSTSTAGVYSILYITPGACPDSSSVSFTVLPSDDPGFNYASSSYCANGSNPTPTITGTAGGTFTMPTGVSFNNSTGLFLPSTATPGPMAVKYVTSGSCPDSSTVTLSILAADDASFSYPSGSVCSNISDPVPTITGLLGGAFTSSVGLSISSSTGVVDASASTAGSYTITYTTAGACPNNGTFSMSISTADVAAFTYSNNSYCANVSDPAANITGTTGGIFQSTSGIIINSGTGVVDLSASTHGSYAIEYQTQGSCPDTSTFNLTILALDNAEFNYASSNFCVNGTDPFPTITGVSGGSFSSATGLTVNSSNGELDLSSGSPGGHSVTYTTVGTCPNSSTFNITLAAADNASFSYSSTSYCSNVSDPIPVVSGAGGGVFTSSSSLNISSTTGVVDLSTSIAGTYSVTYTTVGACPNSSSVSLTVATSGNATFNYGATSYCRNASDPSPASVTQPGGTFGSTSGLVLNSSSGEVDLSLSNSGTYSIQYITGGACPDSSAVSFTVSPLDNANFSYSKMNYCTSDSDPTPSILGLAGGSFSSSPSGLIINSTTGEIDLGASSPGGFSVVYQTSGTCPNNSTESVIVVASDDPSFNYPVAVYCANAANPVPTVSGLPGGSFNSTTGAILSIEGVVDLQNSALGNHSVTYVTNGACPDSATVSLTINAADDASFSYGATSYCANISDPSPTISGLSGGSFATTDGLFVDGSSGEVDLSMSLPGTFAVTYTTSGPCPNSSTVPLIVSAADNPSFAYSASSYCVNGTDPTPASVTTPGGSYSSVSGLTVNSSSGSVDLSSGSSGVHSVRYITAGTCPDTSTLQLTLISADNASFSYSSVSYCSNVTDPSPTISGFSGGSFSAGTGLSLNTSTGVVDLSASTAGSYTVTYLTAGACPNTSTFSLTVSASENASFNYSQAGYCADASDPSPLVTGTTGGSFSAPTGLSIGASTGTVDLSSSTLGTYSVTYITPGSCPDTSSVSLAVNALDDAAFAYGALSYCVNGTDPS